MTPWNPNGPDPDPHIHEHRRQLLLVRGYFDDLAGFPADTQANILTRLRELADLTGEPMLTPEQTEALVRERDTARAEADALRAGIETFRARAEGLAEIIDAIAEDVDPFRALPTDAEARGLPDRVRAVLHGRDTAIAEADALRAEVDRLRPLRALFDFAAVNHHRVAVLHEPRPGWMVAVDDSFGSRWNTQGSDLDDVIAAACDRLGVDHG